VGAGVTERPTRVLIADDQRVVREGLAMLLGLLVGVEVVGTAEDGEQALERVRELEPDVVLMDLRMPRCDGVQATLALREQASSTKVLVLTTYADDRSVLDALRAGARGFLTKDAGAEQIEAAIAAVMRGEAAIDPAVAHHLVEAVTAGAPPAPGARPGSAQALPDGLTAREAEVLALIAEGLSNAQIAQRLTVTEATVKSHINHLFTKTGVRDRAQAVIYAYRHGLAPDRAEAQR
jgi:DNA-binding NarL/FixJ family response regulator